jgi:hypothetical protein
MKKQPLLSSGERFRNVLATVVKKPCFAMTYGPGKRLFLSLHADSHFLTHPSPDVIRPQVQAG